MAWSELAARPSQRAWLAPAGLAALFGGLVTLARWLQPVSINRPEALPGWETIRPPHEVAALAVDGDLIWAGGRDGVVALDRASGRLAQEIRCERPLEYVRALLARRDGSLWIGHGDGLTRWDGRSCATFTVDDGLPDRRVNALAEDQQGRLWAGTWGGAAVFEGESWRSLHASDGLLDDMINVLLVDRQDGLWFGSYVAPRGGLSYLQDGRWQHFATEDGLPHNNVTSLLEDRQGAIWVGTGFFDRGGAVRLVRAGDAWRIDRTLAQTDGLAGAKVRSVFEDGEGRLWLGSEYDGLTILSQDGAPLGRVRDSLANPEVKAIAEDPDGQLWLASLDGLTRVSAVAARTLPFEAHQ